MQQRIKSFLDQSHIIQLATSRDNQPWICSVYFVYDEALNLYWLSYPERRHSLDIAQNPQVAVTMPIKQDIPVISLSAEGQAAIITDKAEVEQVMQRYVAKYGEGRKFYERFIAGTNKHVLYRLTPKQYVLFDEVQYSGEASRQVIELP